MPTVEKQCTCLAVRCHALEQGESIANAVTRGRGELRGVQQGIDRDNLLEQRGHDTLETVSLLSQLPQIRALLSATLGNVPNECHKMSANSGTCSLFLLNSSNAASRVFSFNRSAT